MFFLNAGIKLLFIVFIASVAFALIAAAILIWSESRKFDAAASCRLDRMNNSISLQLASEYQLACMQSKGYRVINSCFLENRFHEASYCFIPAWRNWK